MQLSQFEVDALTEVINIGLGQAANSLNEIMEHHVELNVPKLDIYDINDPELSKHIFENTEISSVRQNFNGEFSGSASLLFPDKSAKNLVANVTGEELDSPDLDSIRSSTLLEIGNIVINAIMGTIGNLLKSNLEFLLPEYQKSKDFRKFFINTDKSNQQSLVVLAETNFSLEKLKVDGFILLIFEVKAIDFLIKMINKYIDE